MFLTFFFDCLRLLKLEKLGNLNVSVDLRVEQKKR